MGRDRLSHWVPFASPFRQEETNLVSRFRIQRPKIMRTKIMRRIIIMRGPKNGTTHRIHFIRLNEGSGALGLTA